MANQTYPSVEITTEHNPAQAAYDRFTARIEWPADSEVLNPQKLGDVRKVVEALTAAGVPDDAYFQTSWPHTWANWERHPRRG